MSKLTTLVLTLAVLFICVFPVFAQDSMKSDSAAAAPPKVLVVSREFLKPGRAGESHKATEAAFVRAMSTAKWPVHYLAVTSMSGRPRALFFTGYDSFADWEKDMKATEKNATLSAALDRAAMADGDLLSDYDGGVFVYRPDYSLNPDVDIPHMRYFEIGRYQVKPGHDKEWDQGVKMVLEAYKKMPDMRFICYQSLYGNHEGTYIFFTPLKSVAQVDAEFGHNKDFETAMGEDGMKHLAELSAASIEYSETNFFAFDPSMSYVGADWIKADPDYWTPKATKVAMAHKAGEKTMPEKKTPQ